jgi:hypothetical protein
MSISTTHDDYEQHTAVGLPRGTGTRVRRIALSVAAAMLLSALAFTASASARTTPLIASFVGSGPVFSGTGSAGSFTGLTTSFTPVSPSVIDTTAIVTFADGSTINFDTVITIGKLDPATGLYHYTQTDTVVGGTGQFTGAAGRGFNIGELAGDNSYFNGHGYTLLDLAD